MLVTIKVQVWGCGGGVGSLRSFGCFWGYRGSAVERVEKEEVFGASLGVWWWWWCWMFWVFYWLMGGEG